jgi:hypothetical protein
LPPAGFRAVAKAAIARGRIFILLNSAEEKMIVSELLKKNGLSRLMEDSS